MVLSHPRRISTEPEFWACGIACYWTNVSGSAFYGKFDIHCEATKTAKVASISNKYIMGSNYTNSVVYSVGNVIDFTNTPNRDIDQVCNLTADGTQHMDFYHFELSDKSTVDCKYATNKSEQYKPLDELKADGFIKNLTSYARRNLWGKITGMSEELNGLPLPIVCGGDVTGLAGQGTEADPFLITSEAELRALQKGTADGTRTTEGLYFKLTNDIYMSSEPMAPLGGYSDYPFKGTFDGCGHAIVGMVADKGCLFGYLAGTLKNLALVDFKASEGVDDVSPLASSVGGLYAEAGTGSAVPHTGTIENCYVTGNLKITPKTIDGRYYDGFISGICGVVHDQGKVNNCYFKGSLEVAERTDGTKPVAVLGGTGWVYGTVSNCYASYTLEKNNNTNIAYLGFSSVGHDGPQSITDCYYVCPQSTYSDKLSSESELNEKFSNKSGWSQGLYRPVLTDVKSYAAKLPDGGTKYLDAVPEPNPQPNYIVNVNISGDPYADMLVWQLPNTAVYVSSEQTDYILNCSLDQDADFKYERSEGATATLGLLRYTLKQNESGYHMLCLPGVVDLGDLPADSKVMIYGKISETGGTQEINEVHVDTIPAGVPCVLYVPKTACAEGSDIPLVMIGEIMTEPLLDAKYSSMKGTFSAVSEVSDACITATIHDDGETYFKKSASTVSMKPFSAWLTGATGDVKIVDYVLLDEENEAMTETLAGLNSTDVAPKTTNVKMRRTVKLGQWNTICLPFDLTKAEVEDVFGRGTKVEELSSLTYNETSKSYTLVFAAVTETDGSFMKAGVPYLIKAGTAKTDTQSTVQLYGFTGKHIICPAEEQSPYIPEGKEVTSSENTTKLTMQGEYNHRVITSEEAIGSKSLYVISGDKIYYVNSEVEMKGFRCYFVAEESTTGSTEGGTGALGTSMFSNARVLHSDGTTTDLRLIKADTTGEGSAVYDLLGRKRYEQTKGIIIENGKKRIIK